MGLHYVGRIYSYSNTCCWSTIRIVKIMPYIHPEDREELDPFIDYLIDQIDYSNIGELNYIITRLCDAMLGEVRYSKINSLIGVLECAKLELYRRVAAPYEDDKIDENGDVYQG